MPFICEACCVRQDGVPFREMPKWRRLQQLAKAMHDYCHAAEIEFHMCVEHWDVDADELGDDLLVLIQALSDLQANYEVPRSYHIYQTKLRTWASCHMVGQLARVVEAPSTVLPLYMHRRCVCYEDLGSAAILGQTR